MEVKKRYTIERHLESFNECDDCKFICGCWQVEKPQYVNRLKSVSQRYPYYSLHDCTHSETILKSIEYILGEERIKLLSPTDTWLILQCAYTHDIGMSISAKDMIKEFNNSRDDYQQKLENQCKNNMEIQRAWEFISQINNNNANDCKADVSEFISDMWSEDNYSKRKSAKLAQKSLNDRWYEKSVKFTEYFAVLSQSLLRPRHGKESLRILSEQLGEKTYNGLITKWFRNLSFEIGEIHTGSFKDVMALPQTINGLCGDYAHPRFVAVLLRLGDLLDLDSNRFNQAQLDVIGEPDYESFTHQIKHSAISELCITPEKITVNADLKTKDVEKWVNTTYYSESDKEKQDLPKRLCLRALKELRDWLSLIEKETENFRVNWLEIVPEDFIGSCPVLAKKCMHMTLDGKQIDEGTLNLHYEITSKRAIEIIEGASLYENEKNVFIRELLQNSLDASCRQIYRDLCEKDDIGDDNSHNKKIFPWTELRDSEKYRIDIGIKKNEENNLVITIRDRGTGISEEMLKKMRYIGSIFSAELNKEAQKMPQCIKPTGNFGIGMQSVFQIVDYFDVETRTRYGADGGESMLRKMKFYSNRVDGSIISYDIESDKNSNSHFGFGTKTIITISFFDAEDFLKIYYYYADSIKIDYLADPVDAYIEQIENYTRKVYSNNIVPVYVNNKKISNNSFGKQVLPIKNLSGLNENNSYLVYDDGISDRFSFYDENIGVMISYKWIGKNFFKEKETVEIYYKSILVDDALFTSKIKIPFFNTKIYLYMGNPEDYLEVNRDHFLKEKYNNIASRIRLTHINAMTALLANDSKTHIIWESDNDSENEYRQSVKNYMSAIIRNYAKEIVGTTKLQDSTKNNLSDCHGYYYAHPNYFRYINSKLPGEQSLIDTLLQSEKNIWFIDSEKIFNKDLTVTGFGKAESLKLICADRFISYPEIAIREAQILTDLHEQAVLVYRIGKRSGGTVKMSENDYWKYVICTFNHHKDDSNKTRLIFPGIGRYETIEVYCLPFETYSKEVLRFNRYFIAPMNIRELKEFTNQKIDKRSDVSEYFKKIIVKECGNDKLTSADYFDRKQKLLLEHVKKYSATKIHATPFSNVDANEICRAYEDWLFEFYKKYHN